MSSAPDAETPHRSLALRVKRRVNSTLKTVGYELRKVKPPPPPAPPPLPPIEKIPEFVPAEEIAEWSRAMSPGDRLVTAPAFVLSSVRSGSTLLRLILNSHPEICAPHELHLRRLDIKLAAMGRYALGEIGLNDRQLRYLLWDRLLDRELKRAGKTQYVNKTPNDSLIWAELAACWPDAKFIFLRRHPGAIVDSWHEPRKETYTRQMIAEDVLAYATGMEQALRVHGGLVLRYEDLTADPESETKRICEFLDVEWTPAMLEYGDVKHGGLRRGLGDWSDKMRSGRVQAATVPTDPDNIPEILRPIARTWGYLD